MAKELEFKELPGRIKERQNKVEFLNRQVPSLLSLDEKGKLTINPQLKDKAKEIGVELAELRSKNEVDSQLLQKLLEVSERYNIPTEDLHRLDYVIPFLEKSIIGLEERIEAHKKADPKKFAAEKDSKVSRIGQDIKALEEARIKLANHRIAAGMVEAILHEREVEQRG